MNIIEKQKELVILLWKFLSWETSAVALSDFAWEVIEYYTAKGKIKELETNQSQNAFWYAIWQIQHLAGEMDEFQLRKQTNDMLDYLEGRQVLPEKYICVWPT